MGSRQWNISASAAFAAYVSSLEALTARGTVHQFDCPVCGGHTQHEVPGATRRFKDFIETYAPDVASRADEAICTTFGPASFMAASLSNWTMPSRSGGIRLGGTSNS
jgi:hypothetical protein